jgi:hypothetical protein
MARRNGGTDFLELIPDGIPVTEIVTPVYPEDRLMRAVLATAFEDLENHKQKRKHTTRYGEMTPAQIAQWLESDEFEVVCELAAIDGGYVRRALVGAME